MVKIHLVLLPVFGLLSFFYKRKENFIVLFDSKKNQKLLTNVSESKLELNFAKILNGLLGHPKGFSRIF